MSFPEKRKPAPRPWNDPEVLWPRVVFAWAVPFALLLVWSLVKRLA
jgi:uncharacterized membrane-anchored protein